MDAGAGASLGARRHARRDRCHRRGAALNAVEERSRPTAQVDLGAVPYSLGEEEDCMAIDFNHTIVSARDSTASAKFLAEMLGLSAPRK
jgi:hypothetical protein